VAVIRREFRVGRFLGLLLMAAWSLMACGCGGGGGTSDAAVIGPEADPLPYTGKVLVTPAGPNLPSQVLDLNTGQSVDLPRSERDLNFGHRDSWNSASGGQELIRSDDVGGISLIAWPSLAVQASLRPKMVDGEVLRIGAIRMSRDRQWMAATVSSANNLSARLRVFDRQGNILATGPLMNNRSTARYDWLPDGRLVFLDEDQLFFYDVRNDQMKTVSLSFPAQTEAGGEGLAVSPDGTQIALTRYTLFKLGDRTRRHSVLYVFSANGEQGRALTEPAAAALDSVNGLRFFDLTWGVQGRHLAFTVSMSGDAAGAPTSSACSGVSVVSALSSAPTPVSGARASDPSGMRFMSGGKAEGRVSSCGSFQWW